VSAFPLGFRRLGPAQPPRHGALISCRRRCSLSWPMTGWGALRGKRRRRSGGQESGPPAERWPGKRAAGLETGSLAAAGARFHGQWPGGEHCAESGAGEV